MDDKKDISLPIAMKATKENLIKILNDSHLPMCILNEIMQNLTYEINRNAQIELQKVSTTTEE